MERTKQDRKWRKISIISHNKEKSDWGHEFATFLGLSCGSFE
jgi:hypothetical protein